MSANTTQLDCAKPTGYFCYGNQGGNLLPQSRSPGCCFNLATQAGGRHPAISHNTAHMLSDTLLAGILFNGLTIGLLYFFYKYRSVFTDGNLSIVQNPSLGCRATAAKNNGKNSSET
ncbi:MAG: hypothetical protein ABL933_01360 [Methyloglobulus sp.]